MSEQQGTGDRQQATGNVRELGKGRDIAERLLRLGRRVIELSTSLPRHPVGRHISTQLVNAGTSAGANYEEARAAESRADFAHKAGVAAKEARETVYWLKLIELSFPGQNVRDVIDEAAALAAILSASRRTALSTPRE